MMVMMGIAQIPFSKIGIPDYNTLIVIISSYLSTLIVLNYKNILILFNGIFKEVYIFYMITLYIITMLCINIIGDPSKHISNGIHQCYNSTCETTFDMFGYKRNKCISKNDNLVSYKLLDIPSENSVKYSIIGKR